MLFENCNVHEGQTLKKQIRNDWFLKKYRNSLFSEMFSHQQKMFMIIRPKKIIAKEYPFSIHTQKMLVSTKNRHYCIFIYTYTYTLYTIVPILQYRLREKASIRRDTHTHYRSMLDWRTDPRPAVSPTYTVSQYPLPSQHCVHIHNINNKFIYRVWQEGGICANWTELISWCGQKVGLVQYRCTGPTVCPHLLISCVQLAQNRLPYSIPPPPPVTLYL